MLFVTFNHLCSNWLNHKVTYKNQLTLDPRVCIHNSFFVDSNRFSTRFSSRLVSVFFVCVYYFLLLLPLLLLSLIASSCPFFIYYFVCACVFLFVCFYLSLLFCHQFHRNIPHTALVFVHHCSMTPMMAVATALPTGTEPSSNSSPRKCFISSFEIFNQLYCYQFCFCSLSLQCLFIWVASGPESHYVSVVGQKSMINTFFEYILILNGMLPVSNVPIVTNIWTNRALVSFAMARLIVSAITYGKLLIYARARAHTHTNKKVDMLSHWSSFVHNCCLTTFDLLPFYYCRLCHIVINVQC